MQTQMSKTQIRKPDTQPGKRTTPTTSKKRKSLTQEEKRAITKVDETIDEIWKAHRIGLELHEVSSGHSRPGVMKVLAEHHDISAGVARRYRQFANMYTVADLNNLFETFRGRRFALTVTHFIKLLDVDDKTVRDKLALDAVRGRMSVSRLLMLKATTIKRTKAPGGRKPDVERLKTEKQQHEAIKWEASKLRRWLDQFLRQPQKFKPSLKKCLNELHKMLQKVEKLSDG